MLKSTAFIFILNIKVGILKNLVIWILFLTRYLLASRYPSDVCLFFLVIKFLYIRPLIAFKIVGLVRFNFVPMGLGLC